MKFYSLFSSFEFTEFINYSKFVALGIFVVAFIVMLFAVLFKLKKTEYTGIGLFFAGWLACLAIFVFSWTNTGIPPFSNMYHVLMTMGIFIPLLYLVIWLKDKERKAHIYFAAAAIAGLIGALVISLKNPDAMTKELPPSLQSVWFIPHVSAYVISYSLMGAAFLMTVVGWIFHFIDKDKKDSLLNLSFKTVKLSFPFMTFGLLVGAVWADQIWGTYWSWDIKESWSLITWGLYVVYFHCRLNNNWRKYASLIQLIAFAALIFTFIIVNFLPKTGSLHTYSQVGSSITMR